MSWSQKTETCRFIAASHLFSEQSNAWITFAGSDPPFTWGDANRTLVSPDSLESYLESLGTSDFDDVLKRLAELPNDVYIDLEN